MPSVDVIVPCYQYGRFLRESVGSVLDQDLQDVRVLIVDNASTDDTETIAHELMSEDPRVHVVRHSTNQGQHASFNRGIDWAKADYFLILCADDLIAPGALSRATSIMEENRDVHLTFGKVATKMPDGSIILPEIESHRAEWRVMSGRELLDQFCASGRNHVHGPTAVVRTSVQKQVGYYRSELVHTDDLEMWMRFACRGGAAETAAVQGVARRHPANQSASVPNIHLWGLEFEAAFESFFSREGRALKDVRKLRATVHRSLGERAYWSGLSHLLRGEYEVGLQLLKFTFRVFPSAFAKPPLNYVLKRADLKGHLKQALRAS